MKYTQLVVEVEDASRYRGWRFLNAFDSLAAAHRKYEAFTGFHVRIRCGDAVLRDSAKEAEEVG